jgi:ATP-dependent Clp protease adaptor protein ClpS
VNTTFAPVSVAVPAVAEIGTEEIVIPDTVEELLGDTDAKTDRPWVVIVWDDPINLMDYVTHVFQKLFGYSKSKARKLMLQVHNEGKAVVASGNRERCENDVARLHAHGLWATMQHDK